MSEPVNKPQETTDDMVQETQENPGGHEAVSSGGFSFDTLLSGDDATENQLVQKTHA